MIPGSCHIFTHHELKGIVEYLIDQSAITKQRTCFFVSQNVDIKQVRGHRVNPRSNSLYSPPMISYFFGRIYTLGVFQILYHEHIILINRNSGVAKIVAIYNRFLKEFVAVDMYLSISEEFINTITCIGYVKLSHQRQCLLCLPNENLVFVKPIHEIPTNDHIAITMSIHGRQIVGFYSIICINETDVLSPCFVKRKITGIRHARMRFVDCNNSTIAQCLLMHHFKTVVCTTVIDKQHLEVCKVLSEDAVYTSLYGGSRIIDWDDYGYLWIHRSKIFRFQTLSLCSEQYMCEERTNSYHITYHQANSNNNYSNRQSKNQFYYRIAVDLQKLSKNAKIARK